MNRSSWSPDRCRDGDADEHDPLHPGVRIEDQCPLNHIVGGKLGVEPIRITLKNAVPKRPCDDDADCDAGQGNDYSGELHILVGRPTSRLNPCPFYQ